MARTKRHWHYDVLHQKLNVGDIVVGRIIGNPHLVWAEVETLKGKASLNVIRIEGKDRVRKVMLCTACVKVTQQQWAEKQARSMLFGN